MLKPIRLAAVLIIGIALLSTTVNPLFRVFAVQPALGIAPTLGVAGSFAVLAASAVTNTGPTVLHGDLGISPNTASSITGFPPGILTGAIHAADAVALKAQNDLTSAYNALTIQGCDLDLSGTDLGGLTLTPGVYCYSSSAQLTGQLTLNAQGDPTAVWVFKIGSTLTTASGSSVVFINGGPGLAGCNVFWQVGSSATLGSTTEFKGNILALQSITMVTGANLTGRALARNAAVTMDQNVVTPLVCAPTATSTPTSTPTPTSTSTSTSTSTPAPTSTATNTPAPTSTPTAASTSTSTPTSTATNTPTPTRTPTPTSTATNTPLPTAVELLYFLVSRNGQTVALEWATAEEVDNFGFRLYRAPVNDFSRAELIHFEPSAIQGGTGSGATYRYRDTSPIQGTSWYWLADIDTHGIQTVDNPSVAISVPFQSYLPWIGLQ